MSPADADGAWVCGGRGGRSGRGLSRPVGGKPRLLPTGSPFGPIPLSAPAGQEYLVADLGLENVGRETVTAMPGGCQVRDDQGNVHADKGCLGSTLSVFRRHPLPGLEGSGRLGLARSKARIILVCEALADGKDRAVFRIGLD
jgi:hypothetical protein